MAKNVDVNKIPATREITSHIKSGKLLPVYLIFGEDIYQTEKAGDDLEQYLLPKIETAFDYRTYHAESNVEEILGDISAYPFGGEKKLVIVKDFDAFSENDREKFTYYFRDPAEFTYLIILFKGKFSASAEKADSNKKSSKGTEYLKVLIEQGFLFESRALRSDTLQEWLVGFAASRNKLLLPDDASHLIMLCGEERSMLEMQIDKIILYMGDAERITFGMINEQVVSTKTYKIWDLDKCFETQNKELAFKIIFSLLDQGELPVSIIGYINKYFTTISRIGEVIEKQIPTDEAAKLLGVRSFLISNLSAQSKRYSLQHLKYIAEGLMQADMEVKHSRFDKRTIMAKLLSIIFLSR